MKISANAGDQNVAGASDYRSSIGLSLDLTRWFERLEHRSAEIARMKNVTLTFGFGGGKRTPG
jgi:hypothetical protein